MLGRHEQAAVWLQIWTDLGRVLEDDRRLTTIVRSSAGTLSYETTSPQHTALEAIDTTTLAITRRYYDPYGNPAGTTPATWPDNHAYLGQPHDPATTLDLLGARQYDPATGAFLTPDP